MEFQLATSQLALSSSTGRSRTRWGLWPLPLCGRYQPTRSSGCIGHNRLLKYPPQNTEGKKWVLSKSANSHGVLQHPWESLAPIPCSAWELNEQSNPRMNCISVNEEKEAKNNKCNRKPLGFLGFGGHLFDSFGAERCDPNCERADVRRTDGDKCCSLFRLSTD